MQPIDTLPHEICQNLVGVAFDVDDTITEAGRLDPDAFSALWSLAGAGLTLVAVTGRPHVWGRFAAGLWPVDLVVTENGGAWVRSIPGAARIEGFFDPPAERARQRARLLKLFDTLRPEIQGLRISDDGPERLVDLTFDGTGRPLRDDEIRIISARVAEDGGRCLVSSVQVHATFCAANKASGMVHAAQTILGFDVARTSHQWLFIGDSGNDADAFAFFPHSVGVANVAEVLPQLGHKPAYVTQAARGKGFAEFARVVLARRGGSGHGGSPGRGKAPHC